MFASLIKKLLLTKRLTAGSLSAKLLLLTIAFVMFAEILILVPTLAKYRTDWLMARLSAAQIAALSLEASPNQTLPAMLEKELLEKAKVHSIAVKRADKRIMALQSNLPHKVDAEYDIMPSWSAGKVTDALAVFFKPDGRVIRVWGMPEIGSKDVVEIVIEETPLKAAMVGHLGRILLLSGFISLFTASLIYFSLDRLLVRPMNRLTSNIMHFAQNPEDRSRVIVPAEREDIIGQTEHALASMQTQLGDMLQQKNRLAMLGLAVSKINHDLRNILASTQLISDRLSSINDPAAQKLAPKLLHSLGRAIRLCSDTLKYGKAQEPTPEREVFPLAPLLKEISDGLALDENDHVQFEAKVDPALQVDADRNQLYRILSNLIRNAAEAIEGRAERKPNGHDAGLPGPGRISVDAVREGASAHITVSDTGPGIPGPAQEHLFKAFQGSRRKGGTGLGLAISAELLHAHGGEIVLRSTGEDGTVFDILLPDRSQPAARPPDTETRLEA